MRRTVATDRHGGMPEPDPSYEELPVAEPVSEQPEKAAPPKAKKEIAEVIENDIRKQDRNPTGATDCCALFLTLLCCELCGA